MTDKNAAAPVVALTEKEQRARYGVANCRLPATRVLQKPMKSSDFNGKEARCLIVINDHDGTMTPGNTYDGDFGERFKRATRPAPDASRIQDYLGTRGYKWGEVSDHPALQEIDAKTGEPVTVKVAATAGK